MNTHEYTSEAKVKWSQETMYPPLHPDHNSFLTDRNGKFKYKWLELVGVHANCFTRHLMSDAVDIHESQFIGITNDVDTYDTCVNAYPNVDIRCEEWLHFCKTYKGNDIGLICFDSWHAAKGDWFKKNLRATLDLGLRCQSTIGECLVVINVSERATKRHKIKDPVAKFKKYIEEVFSEHDSRQIAEREIDEDTIYKYRQHNKSDVMMSYTILLDG